jgi:hypothetical protein
MPAVTDYARHTAYSDPGRHAPLIRALDPEPSALSAVSRNLIAHYRAEVPDLPESRRGEIDSRWVSQILAVDQARFSAPLTEPRPAAERVAGCCRDHALVLVAALREHGIPARTRVGYAGYFTPGFHHDHVVSELWRDGRWIRVDPELESGGWPFDPQDIPVGIDSPFQTAAEAWLAHRAGGVDAATYGLFLGSEFSGPRFMADEVLYELAHRYGDEMLLWDSWGLIEGDGDDKTVDQVAALIVSADGGDDASEERLHQWYRSDPRLHPGPSVVRHSPYGLPPVVVDLRRGQPDDDRASVG